MKKKTRIFVEAREVTCRFMPVTRLYFYLDGKVIRQSEKPLAASRFAVVYENLDGGVCGFSWHARYNLAARCARSSSALSPLNKIVEVEPMPVEERHYVGRRSEIAQLTRLKKTAREVELAEHRAELTRMAPASVDECAHAQRLERLIAADKRQIESFETIIKANEEGDHVG